MVLETLVKITFGLGLFFIGLNLLSSNLKGLTTFKIRQLFAKWTKNKYVGVFWGSILVFITQSTSATTFVLVGMIRSNLISIRQGLPIIIGINLAIGFVIFLLTFNVKIGILFIIGVTGIVYSHLSSSRFKLLMGSMLGIGFLFFGIYNVQEALVPLAGTEHIEQISSFLNDNFILAFLLGASLTVITQSSLPVVVLIIPFVRVDAVSLDEAMMYAYGTNVGSSVLTIILSWSLTGKAKQLAMYQVLYNFFGALILVPLFYIEYYTGTPLIKYFISTLNNEVGQQVALTYIIFNMIPGLLLLFLIEPSIKLLDYVWKETEVEQYSKTKYLYAQMLKDPNTAIDLIYLEQSRMFEIIRHHLNCTRTKKNAKKWDEYTGAFNSLSAAIDDFINNMIVSNSLKSDHHKMLNKLMAFHYQIESLESVLQSLHRDALQLKKTKKGEKFSINLIEGIDAISILLFDYIKLADEDDYNFIKSVTSEEGNAIKKVREGYISHDSNIPSKSKLIYLSVGNHAEHFIGLLHEVSVIVHALQEDGVGKRTQ